jgi:hypothetical protein
MSKDNKGTAIGRPSEYNEETKVVTFRVPISKKKEFREHGNKKLAEYKEKAKGNN